MRRHGVRLIGVLVAIAGSLVLVACGYSGAGPSAAQTYSSAPGACSNATASGAAALPDGDGQMGLAPRAMPVTTLPPAVTVGQVQVVVEDGSYGPSSTIFVWAGNGLSQCIYTTDYHSDCSIVVLERQVDGNWQPQANCPRATPTQIAALPPMRAAFVQLPPEASGTQPGVWPVGTYRVAFSYRLDREGADQPIEVDSGSFTIG